MTQSRSPVLTFERGEVVPGRIQVLRTSERKIGEHDQRGDMNKEQKSMDELAYSVRKEEREKGRNKALISDALLLAEAQTKRDLRTLKRLTDRESKRPERDMIRYIWRFNSSEA